MYRSMLAGPHQFNTRIEVWALGARIDTYGTAGVPVLTGSISASLTSRVARTVSFTTYQDLFPADPSGLLAPFGNYLKIFQGVEGYGGPGYEWQTFYGRIDTCSMDQAGQVTVTAVDRAGDVADSYFGRPYKSQTGTVVTAQFKTLVSDAIPDATFGTFDPIYYLTPNLVWQNDRASACDDLSAAGHAWWYPLANGDFVMRFVPWTVEQTPLLTFTDGDGGTMAAWTVAYSRQNVYNQVTVVGELADGSTPVFATASDNDPASPTYINGKFGLKGQLQQVQTAVSQGQALSLAEQYLRQVTGITDTWTVTIMADPSIELGDAFNFATTAPVRNSSVQVTAGFQMPLDGGSLMSMTMRALSPGSLEQN
jgi:hypothetical protein